MKHDKPNPVIEAAQRRTSLVLLRYQLTRLEARQDKTRERAGQIADLEKKIAECQQF